MALVIFDKFKRDVIFEVFVIDIIKPTEQCCLEIFRTLMISFISVNTIMKKMPVELRAKG